LIAAAGVAEPEDIDRAWKTGTYLDTGPFRILEAVGVPDFLLTLDSEVAAGRFDRDRARRVGEYLLRSQKQTQGI
jgi:3-hydroxyacyl-CoA dehydrogenase